MCTKMATLNLIYAELQKDRHALSFYFIESVLQIMVRIFDANYKLPIAGPCTHYFWNFIRATRPDQYKTAINAYFDRRVAEAKTSIEIYDLNRQRDEARTCTLESGANYQKYKRLIYMGTQEEMRDEFVALVKKYDALLAVLKRE